MVRIKNIGTRYENFNVYLKLISISAFVNIVTELQKHNFSSKKEYKKYMFVINTTTIFW